MTHKLNDRAMLSSNNRVVVDPNDFISSTQPTVKVCGSPGNDIANGDLNR